MSSVASIANGGQGELTRMADGLEIVWPDGQKSFFHHVWLRSCCYCNTCGDSYSSNRFLQPSDVALDVSPRSVETTPERDLSVVWEPDGHQSRYPLEWLRHNRYDEPSRLKRFHRPIHWNSTISVKLPTSDFGGVTQSPEVRLDLLRKLRDYGFVVVRNGPAVVDGVEKIANLIGEVTESAYGKFFDLSPKSTIKTLGNTTKPVPPHTDEAYRHTPPGINVLHCIRPAESAGESVLVDGFNLGEQLRTEDPEAFRLLVTQPQPFHRVTPDSGIDQRARGPVFVVDETDAIVGFRFHTRTAAPLDVAAELVPRLHAANHALSRLMLDESNQACFRLEAGDAVMFDNHRVMHSRKGFSDTNRMLKICNVSREQFHEEFRLEANRLGFVEESNMILGAGVSG